MSSCVSSAFFRFKAEPGSGSGGAGFASALPRRYPGATPALPRRYPGATPALRVINPCTYLNHWFINLIYPCATPARPLRFTLRYPLLRYPGPFEDGPPSGAPHARRQAEPPQRRIQKRGYGVLTAKLPSAAAGDLRDHRPCSQKTAMTSTAHGPARRRPPHDHRPWLVEVAFSGLFCFPPFDFAEECAWRRKCREEAQTPSMLLRLKKGGSRM